MHRLTSRALLLTIASELAGQAAPPTAVKLRAGDSFDFVSTQTITGKDRHTGSQATTCEFTLTIKSVGEDGKLDAVVNWHRLQGATSGPRTASFDTAKSEDDQKSVVAPDLLAGLKAYISLEQRVSYDSTGAVIDLPDQDAALKSATTKAKGFSQLQLRGLLSEGEVRARVTVFHTLPATAKARGDRWLGPATGRLPQHLGNPGQLRHELVETGADRCSVRLTADIAAPPPAPDKSTDESAPPDPAKPRNVAVRNLADGGHVIDAKIDGEVTVLSTGVVAREKLQARMRRATQQATGESGLNLDREVTQTLELVNRPKSEASGK